jgi:anti-anti-sigma factor
METKTEKINQWFIISIYGKFVVKSLTAIRVPFDTAESKNETHVAIDLNNATHVDSSAITLLANFQKRFLNRYAKVVIFGANQDIAEVFSIVGLDKIIPVLDNDQFKIHLEQSN